MRNLAIISFAAMLIAGQAQALILADCDRYTLAHHAGDLEHKDVGNGHITFERFGSFPTLEGGHGNGSSLHLVQCQTGRTLEVDQSFVTHPPLKTNYDYRDLVLSTLTEVVEAETAYTLDELEIVFDAITDGRADIEQSTSETCGCRAAYPRLRGDKTPFDVSELPQ